jgi:O-methyltransferase domain
MTTSKSDENHAALDLLIRGFEVSRMLRLVADLAIADKVPKHGYCDVHELATACAVLPTPLLRVLRALAAFGVFHVTADSKVSHSPRSILLRTDAPNSLHYLARCLTAPGSWKAWGELDAALTGETPFQVAWNTSRFQYLRDHVDEGRAFDAFMASAPDNRHQAIAQAYDFSSAALIVDIGGGNGEALRRILTRFTKPRGLVYDREDVVAAIAPAARLGGRIDVKGGSFFDKAPADADIYLMSKILHDWTDEDCIRILRTCRAAMPAHARLLIAELLLDADPSKGRPQLYLNDMQMMAMFGGARERTEAEFKELLAASGFSISRLITTASPVILIEAIPT